MTARARSAAPAPFVTPKLPRPEGVTPAPTGERSWRTGPQKGASYRSFGTVAAARGRWKAFYTGPDRRRHTPGQTFSNQVRAQGWLAQELALIERGEWTPPAQRRQASQTASTTFEEFAREWIDTRMVHGRPLKARTKEHYLDIHDRWFAPLHTKALTAIEYLTG